MSAVGTSNPTKHHIYLFGSKHGRRMLAISSGTILPPMTREQAIETAEDAAEDYYRWGWEDMTLRLDNGDRYYIGRQITTVRA